MSLGELGCTAKQIHGFALGSEATLLGEERNSHNVCSFMVSHGWP